MPGGQQQAAELTAVERILANVAKDSPAAQGLLQATTTAVNNFGLNTLPLFSSADDEAVRKIAATASPGTDEDSTAKASLVRGLVNAAILDARSQLEILHLRDTQLERSRKVTGIDLNKVCEEAQKAKSSFKVMPNTIPPTSVVKKVMEQPSAYYELSEFLFPTHVYDNDLETITTITGEVVQRRRSDGKKEPVRNIGQWCECFIRYAITTQLSDNGRKLIDFGTLLSYMSHVCAEFEEHPYQAVIQAEAKYRRTGAMAVASGAITMALPSNKVAIMATLFGQETYLRPRLDMEIGSTLSSREHGIGKGKGFGKGKGKGSTWLPAKGKGKGSGKGKGQRVHPYAVQKNNTQTTADTSSDSNLTQ